MAAGGGFNFIRLSVTALFASYIRDDGRKPVKRDGKRREETRRRKSNRVLYVLLPHLVSCVWLYSLSSHGSEF
jgi:hypothetical protein